MPTSNLYLWPEILALVDQVPHRAVVDVGPGHGKAAVLLAEYLNDPPEAVDAVEAWAEYVETFHLNRLYRQVTIADARDVPASSWAIYDVVLMVEVLEHLTLVDGTDMIGRIPGRVVICTPSSWVENPTYPPTEEHRSLWTWADFHALGRPVEVCYESLGGWLVRLGPLGE